jgi:hypothetical protein
MAYLIDTSVLARLAIDRVPESDGIPAGDLGEIGHG